MPQLGSNPHKLNRIVRWFLCRLFLVTLGICAAVGVIEVTFRVARVYLLTATNLTGKIQSNGSLTILCIGESTTRGFGTNPWPSQLQGILQERYPSRTIQVINQGIAGIQSPEIVKNLPAWLDTYHPNIVVSMLGINDDQDHILIVPRADTFFAKALNHLILYRFLELLIKQSSQPDLANPNQPEEKIPDNETLQHKLDRLHKARLYSEEAALLRELLTAQEDPKLYNRLGLLLANEFEQKDQALAMFQRAFTLAPSDYETIFNLAHITNQQEYFVKALELRPDLEKSYSELFVWLRGHSKVAEAEQLLINMQKNEALYYEATKLLAKYYGDSGNQDRSMQLWSEALNHPKHNEIAFLEASDMLQNQGKYTEGLAIVDRGIKEYPKSTALLRQRARLLLRSKDLENAIKTMEIVVGLEQMPPWMPASYSLREKAISLLVSGKSILEVQNILSGTDYQRNELNSTTAQSYSTILSELRARNIQLVAVQYPRTDVLTLLQVLDYPKDVAFVENVSNFESALKTKAEKDLFTDMFGVTFGHMTDAGNQLIAQSVSKAIIGLTSGK